MEGAVRYTRSGDVNLAFRTDGDGPIDVIIVPGGLTVNIGARVGALADAGEVLVSRTVKDLVIGSGFAFEDRGVHALKGVPGDWQLYSVSA